MKWQFTTPRAPHQTGCTEAVMKGAKTGHKKAIIYLITGSGQHNESTPLWKNSQQPRWRLICVPTTCFSDEPHQQGHMDRSEKLGTPTWNRVGAVNSGHLLETLDLRCVSVIGPKKEVECWEVSYVSGWDSHNGGFQFCSWKLDYQKNH